MKKKRAASELDRKLSDAIARKGVCGSVKDWSANKKMALKLGLKGTQPTLGLGLGYPEEY